MKTLVIILVIVAFAAGYFYLRNSRPKSKPVNGNGGVITLDKPNKPEEQQTT